MSKHLGILGSFHRIITSSNVSGSHSSAGIALCPVMCLPHGSSCQCVVLTPLAPPSPELCIRDPAVDPVSTCIFITYPLDHFVLLLRVYCVVTEQVDWHWREALVPERLDGESGCVSLSICSSAPWQSKSWSTPRHRRGIPSDTVLPHLFHMT